MAHRSSDPARQAWLVEHYGPASDADELRLRAKRVRAAVAAMARAGDPVRIVTVTIVPADEAFLCVVEAATERIVREVYRRGRVPFERISHTLPDHC